MCLTKTQPRLQSLVDAHMHRAIFLIYEKLNYFYLGVYVPTHIPWSTSGGQKSTEKSVFSFNFVGPGSKHSYSLNAYPACVFFFKKTIYLFIYRVFTWGYCVWCHGEVQMCVCVSMWVITLMKVCRWITLGECRSLFWP